jgi:hypothetical protein
MHKFLAIIKALVSGEAAIDSAKKTHISKTPGDVTEMGHN